MKKIFFLFLFSFLSYVSFSQVDPPDDEEDEIPIDGFVSVLIAGGIGYGYKLTRKVK
jgi:hypothetical protein